MTNSILTTRQVAELFAVHPTTVMAWADDGRLPHFRTPGGHRRYNRADVEALRASTTISAPDSAA